MFWSGEHFEPNKIYKIENAIIETKYNKEVNPYYYNGGIDILNKDDKYIGRRNLDNVICTTFNGELSQVDYYVCYKYIDNQKFDDRMIAKIGLIHVTDYEWAIEMNGKDCFYSAIWNEEIKNYKINGEKCKASWISSSNNGSNDNREWTMSSLGFVYNLGNFRAWIVSTYGDINHAHYLDYLKVRPVFYLKNTITIKEDTNGSIDSPYIIK